MKEKHETNTRFHTMAIAVKNSASYQTPIDLNAQCCNTIIAHRQSPVTG